MAKKLVLLLILAVSVLSGYWSDWNVPQYSLSTPAEASSPILNTIRAKNMTGNLGNMSLISYQYSWISSPSTFSKCRISCAARSFLTYDPITNLAVCKRDKSQPGKFWNTVLNSAGQLYPDYCIPKLTIVPGSNGMACTLIIPGLFNSQCSSQTQPSTYSGKGYDCCFSSSSTTTQ